MRLTAKKATLLDFMAESLMTKVKASSGATRIVANPDAVLVSSSYIQDLIVIGLYRPQHFLTYEVKKEEEVTLTSTLLDAAKAFADDTITLETLEGNVILRGAIDSYIEAATSSKKNTFNVPITELGLVPANIPFKTVLELGTAQLKTMPTSAYYELNVVNDKLFITTKINNIAPFRREVLPLSVKKSSNIDVALDMKGYNYVFGCNAQKLYAHLYEEAVCTSTFDETHYLSYVSSAVKVM